MSRRNAEFRAGAPKGPKIPQAKKWTARQKLLRHDNYRDWHPPLPMHWDSVGKGASGESSTGGRL